MSEQNLSQSILISTPTPGTSRAYTAFQEKVIQNGQHKTNLKNLPQDFKSDKILDNIKNTKQNT